MPETRYVLAALAISVVVTWSLRAAPFAALAPLRTSSTATYVGSRMPTGIMVILVVYCLRGLPVGDPIHLAAPLAGLVVTVVLHLWRHNALLSILAGTATYVALTSTMLAA